MIIDRKYFELKGRCIIEKLVIENSFRIGVDLPNEACYLYLKAGRLAMSSATANTTIGVKDGIVLNCGNYFADFISKST